MLSVNEYIGYANAGKVAKEAYATGKGVTEIALAKGLLTREQLTDILRPENFPSRDDFAPALLGLSTGQNFSSVV